MEKIDWKNLPFGYVKTNCNIRYYYRNGKWGEMEICEDEYINMHMAAVTLHYGQECFEGLKAYRGRDGKIRIFRWQENAKRMNKTGLEIMMPKIPEEIFENAVINAVKLNEEFVPPFDSGGTLYIRPLYIGISPQVGVKPSKDYMLVVFVTPVGPYFKEGFKPVDVIIERFKDRAAPNGTGNIKVGGNYAAAMKKGFEAHDKGYAAVLYLDPKEKKYIDECGPANFFAIKGNSYITPLSDSILPSITNMSLQELAKDMNIKVEKRKVEVGELSDFEETAMCGTAAVISPIGKIIDAENKKEYVYCPDNQPGKICTKLYNTLTGIQFGEIEDKFSWITIV